MNQWISKLPIKTKLLLIAMLTSVFCLGSERIIGRFNRKM